MKPVNARALHNLLTSLEVIDNTTDMTYYGVPAGKLLLLRYIGDDGPEYRSAVSVLLHDGAGDCGTKELLELMDGGGDVVVDMFLDEDCIGIKDNLVLIDDPFSKF